MKAKVGEGTYRVWLDGTEISHVLEADEEGRRVVQADLDERGRVVVDLVNREVRTVERFGTVRIERVWNG